MPSGYQTKLDEKPDFDISDQFFIESFYELSSCRLVECGSIPWTAIREFGLSKGLEGAIMEEFHYVIRAIDNHVLTEAQNEREAKSRTKG